MGARTEVSRWDRSIALVPALALGYTGAAIDGGAFVADVGHDFKLCPALVAVGGLGLDEAEPGVSRPVSGIGLPGPQHSPLNEVDRMIDEVETLS